MKEHLHRYSYCSNLLDEQKLDFVGGSSYLATLVTPVQWLHTSLLCLQHVRRKGTLRRLIHRWQITNMTFKEDGDIENILIQLEQKLFGVSQSS